MLIDEAGRAWFPWHLGSVITFCQQRQIQHTNLTKRLVIALPLKFNYRKPTDTELLLGSEKLQTIFSKLHCHKEMLNSTIQKSQEEKQQQLHGIKGINSLYQISLSRSTFHWKRPFGYPFTGSKDCQNLIYVCQWKAITNPECHGNQLMWLI